MPRLGSPTCSVRSPNHRPEHEYPSSGGRRTAGFAPSSRSIKPWVSRPQAWKRISGYAGRSVNDSPFPGSESVSPAEVSGPLTLETGLLSQGTAGSLALATRLSLAELYLNGMEASSFSTTPSPTWPRIADARPDDVWLPSPATGRWSFSPATRITPGIWRVPFASVAPSSAVPSRPPRAGSRRR